MPFWKRKSKEERFIQGVEKDLAWHRAEHIKLVHQKALIEAALEASTFKIRHLGAGIANMRAALPPPADDRIVD